MNIEFEFFDPNYWMFNVGLALERYEEHDATFQWVRKQFVIGLLLFNINISWKIHKIKMGS